MQLQQQQQQQLKAESKALEDDEESVSTSAVPYTTKIFYASRTHSQIKQFVGEIRSSAFGASTKVVVLGSRGHLCVNASVRALGSAARINERCRELREAKRARQSAEASVPGTKRKRADTGGCRYYHPAADDPLASAVLAQIADIEDLAALGTTHESCPYYATRRSIATADVVSLPYSMLVHRETRKALGIDLAGQVVLIDEAHNLVEAIRSAHAAEVTRDQLERTQASLAAYRERYMTRLRPASVISIQSLEAVIAALRAALGEAERQASGVAEWKRVFTREAFLCDCCPSLEAFGLFDLVRFVESTDLAHKLHGFAMLGPDETRRFDSPILSVIGLLGALGTASADGRIVLTAGSVRFLLLNPAAAFGEVLRSARAVVLAGGTLSPLEPYLQQLLGRDESSWAVPRARVRVFSCGHVIPEKQLVCIRAASAPSGLRLTLTHSEREQADVLAAVAASLVNIARLVPRGMVVFFPSFAYEQKLFAATDLARRLGAIKRVFREPHGSAAHGGAEALAAPASAADALLAYEQAVASEAAGAVLSCVVGGSMSEGINFKDELGRCIVVVGLPFPNPHDAELRARAEFFHGSDGVSGEFLESLAMKAVNQSIGRAIRHVRDYAAIVLLDSRYERSSIEAKLPGWIGKRLVSASTFGEVCKTLVAFFREQQ